MKKFALIGRNIAESKSPSLFKAAYGGKWGYDLLDGTDFGPLFERFVNEYDAVNVTAPFKEEAFDAATERTEEAQLCGAANMLLKGPGGKIIADNSDFEGVTLSLMSAYAVAGIDVDDEDGFDDFIAEKTALVVGCGGAGKAAAAACVTMGFGETIIVNRTHRKAVDIVHRLKSFYSDLTDEELRIAPWDELDRAFNTADVVVWTLPADAEYSLPAILCTDGAASASGASAGTRTDGSKIILEAEYKNPRLQETSGNGYLSGLNWLINQAVISYEAFTGIAPDEEAMQKALQ